MVLAVAFRADTESRKSPALYCSQGHFHIGGSTSAASIATTSNPELGTRHCSTIGNCCGSAKSNGNCCGSVKWKSIGGKHSRTIGTRWHCGSTTSDWSCTHLIARRRQWVEHGSLTRNLQATRSYGICSFTLLYRFLVACWNTGHFFLLEILRDVDSMFSLRTKKNIYFSSLECNVGRSQIVG